MLPGSKRDIHVALVGFLFGVIVIFLVIMWFWLLITVIGDLFRRDDVGGFGKVLWIIFLVFAPYLGVFAYLLTQSSGMASRGQAATRQARDELRQVVGFSAADELEKLDRLKAAGTITADEHGRLRARALA
jgi:energy-coupling factor transporter transmembrane protein EcfT